MFGGFEYSKRDMDMPYIPDPSNPVLLWEFNNPALGYATTGPAVVRVGDASANGKWFAVFGSGPTGPIDTSIHQFMGRSNQTLKFFIVEIKTGAVSGDYLEVVAGIKPGDGFSLVTFDTTAHVIVPAASPARFTVATIVSFSPLLEPLVGITLRQ